MFTKVCRCLCRASSPPNLLALFDDVLKVFDKIASGAPSYAQVPETDCVLRCSAHAQEGVRDDFWWMIIASGRSGPHHASQTFVRLHMQSPDTEERDLIGQLLHYEFEDLVPLASAPPKPFLGAQAAAPRFYDEAEVASRLVGASSTTEVSEVVFTKLLFEDSGSGLRIVGESPSRWVAKGSTATAAKSKASRAHQGFDFMGLLRPSAHAHKLRLLRSSRRHWSMTTLNRLRQRRRRWAAWLSVICWTWKAWLGVQ